MPKETLKRKPLFLHLHDFKLISSLMTDIQAEDTDVNEPTPDDETKLLWKVNQIISNIERAAKRRSNINVKR